jgi:hypothetical protein
MRPKHFRAFLCLLVALAAGDARAQTRPATTQTAEPQFVRFVDDNRGGGTLEVAISRYQNPAGVTVDLVGAVHVGEPSYYAGLDERFNGYDTVLYEMVKPRGAPPPRKGMQFGGAISGLQQTMQKVLGLEYQLNAIDYTRPHFVNADLTWEDFERLRKERGEGMLALFLRAMANRAAREGPSDEPGGAEILGALTSDNPKRALKLVLSRSMRANAMELLDGPQGTVLIHDRNAAAIDVLQKTLEDESARTIAIFYGVAHMPDLDERLAELGFTLQSQEWVMAWDMRMDEAK